ALITLVTSCDFPKALLIKNDEDPWYTHVRANGSRGVEYYIRHNVIEILYPGSNKTPVRWKCSTSFHEKHLLKREDHLINSYYVCAKFLVRSRSIVQVMWSREVKVFDLSLCEDKNLILDPWPLVRYTTLYTDYKPCPFSGGYDMKVEDSRLGENGCNRMLRPMRMEAECLGGEGVSFDFISSNCLPDIKMYVKQKTMCVTHWRDQVNFYVILRRNEDDDLWCMVMPVRRHARTTAYLFADLSCRTDAGKTLNDLKYFTLHLHTRVYRSLCEDEYDKCSELECNSFLKHECQKSCKVCDPDSPPPSCEYPENIDGTWFLKTPPDRVTNIEITRSNLSIENVGNFLCVMFPDSPKSKTSNIYTAISLYDNGCRPRYTCVKIRRFGQSVIRYTLSQSHAWPSLASDIGEMVCNEDRFHADPLPIDDMYRSYEGAGKPIVAHHPRPEPINCNVTSIHTISATLPEGYVCLGSLYHHCEDATKLRMEFGSCGNLIPASTDYRCLADFEGHYWERILLVQNVNDETDAICFVFSKIYPTEAYVFTASQCDQKSFSFARGGIRKPLLKLEFRKEPEPCKSI
ncbi:unnamed protein product, partial [Lymnaea stagnalis]